MNQMTATRKSEKDEERDCDGLVESFLGKVRRFTEPRATMIHKGTSDREYVLLGTVLRWEVKAEDGKLSAEQYELLKEDHESGRFVGCGTFQDLQFLLLAFRRNPTTGREFGWRLVQLWAARGLRRGKQNRKTA